MIKFYFLSIFGFLFSINTIAQTYYTGWDSETEIAGWIQLKKGDQGLYEWIFEDNSPLSPDSVLIHYYPVGGSIPTDDWFISPAFDFFGGGQIDTIWKSFSGFGTPQTGDTIALYLLNGSSDPDFANKTLIYNFTDSIYQNDNVWRKDSSISIPSVSGSSYIAFRYYTTNNWLDVKFDNLTITGIPETNGISSNKKNSTINLFPNPTSSNFVIDYLDINQQSISTLEITDLNGKVAKSLSVNDQFYNISDLENGFYLLVIRTTSGDQIVKEFSVIK